MKINRFDFIIISLLLSMLLAACASTAPPPAAPSSTAALPPETEFPLTTTDDLGREITIEQMPRRIVSLLPSNTEILFAVGAGDRVVGVTSYCNYPPEAAGREQVGGITNKSLSVEAIVALEPDLVLAAGAQDEIIKAMEQAGLTVIVLKPATLADIYTNIQLVGQITGHADRAAAVVADMRRRAEAVSKKVAAIPADERLTVFYEVWDEPLMTAGPNTFIGQMIEMAGGKNIFAEVDEDWPQVSPEVIVARNPAVILGPQSHGDALMAEQIAARPGWANLAAVQNGRIYLLDGDMISRPGPRLIDVLEEIARDLYPD
jgi:iron complex transport system substrate-binding protein